MGRPSQPLTDRFWAKVDKQGPDDCWVWLACTDGAGYGRINQGGGQNKMVFAHRVSWKLHYGPIPEGMCVLHGCDVPGCVNPGHLFLGTRTDNMRDSISRGRNLPKGFCAGEQSPVARLTWTQVDEIRSRYAQGGITQKALGKEFGVHEETIGSIIRHDTWKEKYH